MQQNTDGAGQANIQEQAMSTHHLKEGASLSPACQSMPVSNDTTPSKHTLRTRPWRTQVTDFATIVSAEYKGSGVQDDPFIVTWIDNDLENPKEYGLMMKCWLTGLIAFMTLCVTLASSAYTGAAKEIIVAFGCSEEVFLLGLSFYVLGFALGPVIWAPLSEVLGRRKVLLVTMVFYTIWTGVCAAAPNIQSMIIFRLFCGTIGSASLVLPAGAIADMFDAHQRGVAIGVYAAAPWLGPCVGPLIGGFLSPVAGFRWLFGLLAVYAALLTLAGILFLPETYSPVLLRERAKKMSEITGQCYMTSMDFQRPIAYNDLIRKSLVLPWALLFREPIVLLLSIYMSIIYATLYLCFAAFPIVFQEGRGWNAGEGGLAFLGVLIGVVIGVIILIFDNRRYTRIHFQTGGSAPPEARLPLAIFGGVCGVVGLAWFAATVSPGIPWPVPLAATIFVGIGLVCIFMACSGYL